MLGAVTAVMIPFRDVLDKAHVTLAYLLVVLGGSARGGRGLGLTLAGVAFLLFDVVFLPPYGTLVVERALDWLVLVAFLITGAVAAQLFERARAEADAARQRAAEVDRLSTLGAETLNAGRADAALRAVVAVIRAELELDGCAVYFHDEEHGTVQLAHHVAADGVVRARSGFDDIVANAARSGSAMAIRSQGVIDVVPAAQSDAQDRGVLRADTQDLLIPLKVRERTVGVLSVTRVAGLALEPAQRRFLNVLAYYAALGIERVRLGAKAEHAEALRESARLKDAVIASVSHDLRTPLTTIKALAHELALSGDDRASIIEEEADRLNALVADLLDLSRLNSGSMALTPEPNEAEDLLGAALQRVTGTANGRQLRVSLHEGEPLLFGRFDFAQTLRALVNLIENAIKYSPPEQPVDIAVRREDGWLAFSVADRGPGIPSEERERVFEPFYRPARSAPDVGGSGLGLSIARGVAEAQGGSLRYEPRSDGGSVFTFRVPAVDVDEMADA
jgi:two-component system sensor histidine kinase KdpD